MSRHHNSLADDLTAVLRSRAQRVWNWAKGSGRHSASILGYRILDQLRINLSPRRLLSFPHILVVFWMVILLWGERWVFDSKVDSCDWDHWENWVSLYLVPLLLRSPDLRNCLHVNGHSPKERTPIILFSSPILRSSTPTATPAAHGLFRPLLSLLPITTFDAATRPCSRTCNQTPSSF
jgi:hypothetical protein